MLQSAILTWQAMTCSPAQDELGQLTASIATAQSGDTGFYRVNPPLTKWISGLAVTATRDVPQLFQVSPSLFRSGNRFLERTMPEIYIEQRLNEYRWDFRIGRMARIVVICLITVVSLRWLRRTVDMTNVTKLFAIAWCASPLMLGHGWTVMPDAVSGATMLALLCCNLVWLRHRNFDTWLVTGVAWGMAISTKFTFCPLFLLWPIALLTHQCIIGGFSWKKAGRLLLAFLGQGFVALVIVWSVYNFMEIGVSIADHHFASERMRSLFGSELLSRLPSPFPKQFLVGIDEQQLDLERGHRTYVLGTWYPDGVWWYYLFGLAAKESLAMWGILTVAIFGIWRLTKNGCRGDLATFAFASLTCLFVIFVLSINYKMGLNVRYAIPALPGLYLAGAVAFGGLFAGSSSVDTEQAIDDASAAERSPKSPPRPPVPHRRLPAMIVACVALIAITETLWVFPNHFAYINPLVGGMYRVPLVLHDSNFDGEQDIWRLERELASGRFSDENVRFYLNTKIPAGGFDFVANVPDVEEVERVLGAKRDWSSDRNGSPITLIVSRGFEAPMPWTSLFGRRGGVLPAVKKLLRLPPDEWATPTIVVYRSGIRPNTPDATTARRLETPVK